MSGGIERVELRARKRTVQDDMFCEMARRDLFSHRAELSALAGQIEPRIDATFAKRSERIDCNARSFRGTEVSHEEQPYRVNEPLRAPCALTRAKLVVGQTRIRPRVDKAWLLVRA